jgi:hypothetical protein
MSRISRAGVAVGAFFLAVVLPRATLPMADGDAWWHIHAGEEILATGRVADTNTWTIAGDGFAWTSQDWLSNVIMATLYNAGGWGLGWLSLVFALAVVAAFALLWRALDSRVPTPGWLARMLWLTAGLVVAGPIVGIRVQTVDLLMAAAVVWILWRYVAAPRPARLLLLPVIAVLWVNLHAGWVMLFLLGGAVLAGEAFDRWRRPHLVPAPLQARALGWLAVALLACGIVLALNPNGVDIYAYPFRTAAIGAHRDFLVEWSPPDVRSFEGQATIAFGLAAALPTLVLGRRTLRTSDVLWLGGLSLLAMSAVRFALFLGPIGAALAAAHMGPRITETDVGRAVAPVLRRFAQPPIGTVERVANGVLLSLVVLLGAGITLTRANPAAQLESIIQAVPMGAAAWIAEQQPNARIFNTYAWGGYLSRELPQAKVYIDGRSDIYGDEPIQRYASVLNVDQDPAPTLNQAEIDIVVLKPEAPLNDWLATNGGWERAFADEVSLVWRRAGETT